MVISDQSISRAGNPSMLIPRPEAIIVPRRHGEILIEPPSATLVEFLSATNDRTQTGGNIESLKIKALSELARRETIEAINRFARETGFESPVEAMARPWVITGHQVEFYHPGVWAKVILTDHLARRCHGMAIDLLVDHDTVDHLGFPAPFWHGTRLEKTTVAWAEASALPAEFLSAPQGDRRQQWLKDIQQLPLAATDSMRQFASLLAADSDTRYVSWMSRARRNFEQTFGIHIHHVPCGYICSGVAWHSFLIAWLRNAQSWCQTYNDALDDYRRRQGITNPGRPMPNLDSTVYNIEMPFWIYSDQQPRQRLVLRNKNGLHLVYGDDHIEISDLITGDLLALGATLGQRLEQVRLHVRPRALTLTMFVRLLLSDLFIHGIGGALYDQMTDQVMERLFGVRPAYACASAGWLHPVAKEMDRRDADISQLKWQRHHVRSNPELLVPQSQLPAQAKELSKLRQDLIQRIARSLAEDRRRGCQRGSQWLERRNHFRQLQHVNNQLLEVLHKQVDQLDSQITDAELFHKNLEVACWREYFLALHPRASLETLIKSVQSPSGPLTY